MSLHHLQLDQITVAHLRALIDSEVREGKDIEYKEQMPGTTEGNKHEFLADIVSFANCGGGDILYGISDKRDPQGNTTGIPDTLTGVTIANLDLERRRLGDIIRTGLEPRVSSISFYVVQLDESKAVLIIRIPRSWSSPHLVKYQGSSRFYSRSSAGKYQLDVNEIRSAFLQSEALTKKLQDFRLDRLSQIANNTGPIQLTGKGFIVLHLIPFQALGMSRQLNPSALLEASRRIGSLRAISCLLSGSRYNLDGVVSYSKERENT